MPTGDGKASYSTTASPASDEAETHEEQLENGKDDGLALNKVVATVAVVAVGAAVFEAALLPGIALGVAAVAAPKYFPRLAGALNPLFKSTVRGSYKLARKSKEMFADAHEHVNDIVAEVKAENEAAADMHTAAREAAAPPNAPPAG